MSKHQERTLLVGLELTRPPRSIEANPEAETDIKESMEELAALAESAGAKIIDRLSQARPARDPATLVGSGKVDEIEQRIHSGAIDTVIFDHELTPTQLRNLDRRLDVKVLDRTQLILDIFASRARTREGQLQVELAQLTYLLPRLAGRGTEMSRLGGGIGTRGPGETQLETDRRRIAKRIAKLKKEIEQVRTTRGVQRSQRQAVPLSTVSLVGYTNAGKSTLFNLLTRADVLTDSRMFATLDPTVRQIQLPSHRPVLVSDTVGFIRNLPTTLVNAFRATLEEVTAAALLLHVVDVTAQASEQQTTQVMKVLREIDAERTPQILVLNKSDQLTDADRDQDPARLVHRLLGETARRNDTPAALISARTGDGLSGLLRLIDQQLLQDPVARQHFRLPSSEGRLLNLLYERTGIISKRYEDDYCEIVADAPQSIRDRLAKFVIE